MVELRLSAAALVQALLGTAKTETVCILDSCGVGHLGSHLLIAGIAPAAVYELEDPDPESTLRFIDEKFSETDRVSIFTISYDFGNKLLGIKPQSNAVVDLNEPDLFLASFESLIVHDYDTGRTRVWGNHEVAASVAQMLVAESGRFETAGTLYKSRVCSNFTPAAYMSTIEVIKESIRRGDTYQTNLTQQMSARLPDGLAAEQVFWRLRSDHPAPFSSFIKRRSSTVISASPERFFRVRDRIITASPIKGTRPRSGLEDDKMRRELVASEKDIAENTMIVDLLRNDVGRVCEFGSVQVEKLCDLEEHPTLFHLVSTIRGQLRPSVVASNILRALFPSGSITGAPKISTMRIIAELETSHRGLSMGAIGYCVPSDAFGLPRSIDVSVAIRTMVIRDDIATFNVGGGIVIDSDPKNEYDESLTKAKALLNAIGADFVSDFKTLAGTNL